MRRPIPDLISTSSDDDSSEKENENNTQSIAFVGKVDKNGETSVSKSETRWQQTIQAKMCKWTGKKNESMVSVQRFVGQNSCWVTEFTVLVDNGIDNDLSTKVKSIKGFKTFRSINNTLTVVASYDPECFPWKTLVFYICLLSLAIYGWLSMN